MAIATFHGLQAAVAPAVVAQKCDRDASSHASTHQWSAELHVAHHQDLIQQRQLHPLVFFAAASHHQLLTIKASAAIGTQQIEAPHQRFGRRRLPGRGLLERETAAIPSNRADPSSRCCNTRCEKLGQENLGG